MVVMEIFMKIKSINVLHDLTYPDLDESINKTLEENKIKVKNIINITKDSDIYYRIFYKID
jgi:hypothetical protein